MPTCKCETGAAVEVLCTGYWPHVFLYVLDELFHIFKQLKADDFDAQCIVMWEILHIAQCHCTEWHGLEKAKEVILGDAYPYIDFQDVAKLEPLAWAIYNSTFVLGQAPDLSGYLDWDCIVVGMIIPLIYQGEMSENHCRPTTITGTNAKEGTECMKGQGLPCYKDRRMCVTSSEVPAWKSPSVKSKVTVPPRTRSSRSGQGSLVAALDQVPSPGACHWVRKNFPRKLHDDPVWEPT